MRRAWPLLMAALVSLFVAEGQRAFFASLFALTDQALSPTFQVGAAVVALLPLLALLAPALPLARWSDRHAAVAIAALGAGVFRLPMMHPALATRMIGGALVLACGAAFLKWAVGYLDRHALGAGVVLGLVVDQLLRLAGSGYDLSLQPGWLPVQAFLSLALIAVVTLWTRIPDRGDGRNELERRSGGLRLRGALALGALFFMDLHVLGLPPVIAQWTGTGTRLAGVLVGAAGALAVAGALVLRRPTGGRTTTLLGVAVVAASALLGYTLDGTVVAVAMAAGHLAALLLMTRALDPASGRRSGFTVTLGFALFAVATMVYGASMHGAPGLPAVNGGAPWLFGAVGVILAACFILLPRPAALPPLRSRIPAGGLAAAILAASVALSMAGRPTAEVAAGPVDGAIRVVLWDASHGFDEGRFDPEAVAEALRAAGADVVALWDAPVGAPAAYGMDLPQWLGRRTGLEAVLANGVARPDALLARLSLVTPDLFPVPAGTGEGVRLVRLDLAQGGARGAGPVALHALQVSEARWAAGEPVERALSVAEGSPLVVLAAESLSAGGDLRDRLMGAGLRPVAVEGGDLDAGQLWVRGLHVDSVAVLRGRSARGRGVAATLHILDRPIRSNQAHDLQAP